MRNAVKGAFPAELASDLPAKLDLDLSDESDKTVLVDSDMQSSVSGVFMVGDANS